MRPRRRPKKSTNNGPTYLQLHFGVSYLTVLHRLVDMGIGNYNSLIPKFIAICKQKYGQSFDNHKEPFGLSEPDFVENHLLSLVRRALDKSLITVSRAAEILNVSLADMRQIINSWTEIAA